jgi:outer membrane protein
MSLKKTVISSTAVAALLLVSGQSLAAPGDWVVRFGAANVSPDDSSRGVVPKNAVGVDSGTSLYVTGEYMFSDQLGVELLAALPFNHDITLKGSGKIGEVDHLPPTLSVMYHFSDSNVRPYVGAGINYTTFMDEKATAVISSLKLDASWGLAVQAGVDVDINDDWFFNASARYIDIDTTARTNLGNIDVDIDPWVFSLGIGRYF